MYDWMLCKLFDDMEDLVIKPVFIEKSTVGLKDKSTQKFIKSLHGKKFKVNLLVIVVLICWLALLIFFLTIQWEASVCQGDTDSIGTKAVDIIVPLL